MKSISSGALAAFALGIALFAGAPAHADEAESYESLSNETISLLLQPSSTKHQGPERVPLTDAGAEHVTDNPVLAAKVEEFRSAIRTGNVSTNMPLTNSTK